MAVTLDAYITDTTELFLYSNQNQFQKLCSIDGETYTAALSGTRLDRAYTALNWGKAQIDSALKNVYAVPFTEQAVSASYPSAVVKGWNAKLAVCYLMDVFHLDRKDDGAELLQEILDEIAQYTRADGLELDLHMRSAQPATQVINGKNKTGTAFDGAGYWPDNIVPSDQTGYLRNTGS